MKEAKISSSWQYLPSPRHYITTQIRWVKWRTSGIYLGTTPRYWDSWYGSDSWDCWDRFFNQLKKEINRHLVWSHIHYFPSCHGQRMFSSCTPHRKYWSSRFLRHFFAWICTFSEERGMEDWPKAKHKKKMVSSLFLTFFKERLEGKGEWQKSAYFIIVRLWTSSF